MQEVVATCAVQIRTVVECVHLVDPDAAEACGVRFDGVEDRDRFAVRERHDEISTVLDQTYDVLRFTRTWFCVEIVAMRPADATRLVRFHHTLSRETTYLRFFSFHPELSTDELYRFTHVDHRDREAVVAVADREIVGVARFDRVDDSTDAEVAFVVADSWQGRGLGTRLFEHLARRARDVGIDRFVADTLAHNRPMLAVFHHAGTARHRPPGGGSCARCHRSRLCQ